MPASDHAWPTFDPGSFTTVGGAKWTKWVGCFQWNGERERERFLSARTLIATDLRSEFQIWTALLNKGLHQNAAAAAAKHLWLCRRWDSWKKKTRFRDKKEATVFLSAQMIKITYSPLGCWKQPGRGGEALSLNTCGGFSKCSEPLFTNSHIQPPGWEFILKAPQLKETERENSTLAANEMWLPAAECSLVDHHEPNKWIKAAIYASRIKRNTRGRLFAFNFSFCSVLGEVFFFLI